MTGVSSHDDHMSIVFVASRGEGSLHEKALPSTNAFRGGSRFQRKQVTFGHLMFMFLNKEPIILYPHPVVSPHELHT